MIWAHPGGFLVGDKQADDMIALCDTFARRGYVTASIMYRLGFNPFDGQSAERAAYRANQDGRAAIRYRRKRRRTSIHLVYAREITFRAANKKQ